MPVWPRYSHRDSRSRNRAGLRFAATHRGQVADLEGEGKKISVSQLKYIHERKTSALLCCSVRLGGMSANAAQPNSPP